VDGRVKPGHDGEEGSVAPFVIPGSRFERLAAQWIPGLRLTAHPGMTAVVVVNPGSRSETV
jgi:hypothetical protein